MTHHNNDSSFNPRLPFRNLPQEAKETIDANIKEFNEQRAEMDREVRGFKVKFNLINVCL